MGLADGPSGYPEDWYDRTKEVKNRDDNKCQICNEGSGTELHVHHIVPKSQGGSHNPSNLLTLCWSCHNDQHEHEISRMKPNLSAGGNISGSAAKIPKTEGEWKEGESPTEVFATGNSSEHETSVSQANANDTATNVMSASAADKSSIDPSNPTASVSSQNGNPRPSYLKQLLSGLLIDFILLLFVVGNTVTAFAVEKLLFRSAEGSIPVYLLSVLVGFLIFSIVWQIIFDYFFELNDSITKGIINDYIALLIFVGAVCIPAIGLGIIMYSIVWFYIGAAGGLFCVTMYFGWAYDPYDIFG